METDAIASRVLRQLEEAWNAGDGQAYAAPYEDDASFVNIRGERSRGVEAIAEGHAQILATIYAGSTNRLALVDAQRLGDDVIVVTSRNTLDSPAGPLAGVHDAMSTSVLRRHDDEWRIAVTHNTLVGGR
ncbi:MAG TPA: SgcJ/EcaC family oxidoreductase [Acidimicrobiales bacterium]|nr:SgcJ/EcaC family oxidoreductase [Acidimicrobiales bacterium]